MKISFKFRTKPVLKKGYIAIFLIVVVLFTACSEEDESASTRRPSPLPPTRENLTPIPPPDEYLQPINSGGVTTIWANDGGDKVTRDDLRASRDPASVLNSVWDGNTVSLFGAHNEVVAFNLVIEAPEVSAKSVSVNLPYLEGPDGYRITGNTFGVDDLFNYVDREIELFFVRYLQIRGISTDLFFSGYNYDERHIPERCRRPMDSEGQGVGVWEDRPCRDLFFPEIAVPLELESPFDIQARGNQSIWVDIYIPRDAPSGIYQGFMTVSEGGKPIWEIPVQLDVMDFTLPDLPAARTMVYVSRENIKEAYLGDPFLDDLDKGFNQILDRHFQLAHRHKISLIDSYLSPEEVQAVWLDRLDGTLFTPQRGYEGVGIGVGNNIYSIGTYGDWPWMGGKRKGMWENTDHWVNWFESQNLSTPTEYFLYLIDESDNYRQVEKWARWIKENPGPGGQLLSLATLDLPDGVDHTPSLSIPAAWARFGITETWSAAAEICRTDPEKRLYLYNSSRPATGSFAIEDEGTALRQLAWAQYKMGVDRWFYWEGTYYHNYQCYDEGSGGQINLFQQAQTYGCLEEWDPSLGETGWNYLNGDGVLFYPGTDLRFPEDSYNVPGPFSSLRLKNWRRGIQDVDYISLAEKVNPERTAEIVQSIIPSVLWEVGVADLEDPTYVYADISWPTDPEIWEAARAELAEIILSEKK